MRSKKNMVIGILCLTLVFMGIGYSLFSSTLNITGSSQGSGTFDVKITNVEVDSNNTSGAVNAMDPIENDYAVTETTLVATFNAPGDYITYDITVTNRGSIDAVIDVEEETDSDGVYTLTCDVEDGEEVLANGGTITFPCTMTLDANHSLTAEQYASLTTGHMSVSVKASQKATYNPGYIDQESSCYISFVPGEINYYDTSKPGCDSTTPEIPENLRLKTSTLNSVTLNSTACTSAGAGLNPDPEHVTTEQFCQGIGQQIAQMDTETLYSSILSAFAIPNYTEATGEYAPITKLGIGSFGLRNLTSVTIPNNITEIKDAAFTGNSLQSVTLPSRLTTIGDYAFIYNQLTQITIPNRVTTIGVSAFDDNYITGALTIPRSVTSIGESAFAGEHDGSNNKITSIVFESGSNLQTIGYSAFRDNILTGTLTIPASVTSIGDYAFAGRSDDSTNQITTLSFENNSQLQTIGESAFAYNALTGTLTIPASVTSIGDYAFAGGSDGSTNQITTLSFENNSQLQTIGEWAFSYNALTGTLTIPTSVTSIGRGAFYSNRITSFSLASGSHLQTIGNSAFSNNLIQNIDFNGTTSLQTIGSGAFSINRLRGTLTIPASVKTIENSAFFANPYGDDNILTGLVFENGSVLEEIGDSAFAQNHIGGTVTIPDTVKTVENSAFNNNQKVTLNIGSGVTSIEAYAFGGMHSTLATININMKESLWNSNVTKGEDWYQGLQNIVITYLPE